MSDLLTFLRAYLQGEDMAYALHDFLMEQSIPQKLIDEVMAYRRPFIAKGGGRINFPLYNRSLLMMGVLVYQHSPSKKERREVQKLRSRANNLPQSKHLRHLYRNTRRATYLRNLENYVLNVGS